MAKRFEAASNLKLGLNNGAKDADIILFQEPNAVGNKVKGLYNGKVIAFVGKLEKNKNVRAGIWIKNNLYKQYKCTMLGDFTDRDMVAMIISIQMENRTTLDTVVCSIYMPGHYKTADNKIIMVDNPINTRIENLIDFCTDKNFELIIGCDANSHHVSWGSKKTNTRGIKFYDFIFEKNLGILNKGREPTFEQNNRKTIIDLT